MSDHFKFDFNNPNLLLQKTAANTQRRASGTVYDSVAHGIVHTPAPDSTIHHVVTAACPHPTRELEMRGVFYRVAYVSVPLSWIVAMTPEFATRWDVTFVGPAGSIQKLPTAFQDMEELLGARVYIGFDWRWLGDNMKDQPTVERMKDQLTRFVTELRSALQPNLL